MGRPDSDARLECLAATALCGERKRRRIAPMETPPADAANTTADTACTHRWVLGATTERGTEATCRLCHAVRTFTDARSRWTPYGAAWVLRSQPPPDWLPEG